ncbi:hypothetical protein D3C76_1759360 [compost metagenome]
MPAVLVDVEVALGIDVALAGFQRRLHVPDPVQFIACVLRVQVPGLDDLCVLERG